MPRRARGGGGAYDGLVTGFGHAAKEAAGGSRRGPTQSVVEVCPLHAVAKVAAGYQRRSAPPYGSSDTMVY